MSESSSLTLLQHLLLPATSLTQEPQNLDLESLRPQATVPLSHRLLPSCLSFILRPLEIHVQLTCMSEVPKIQLSDFDFIPQFILCSRPFLWTATQYFISLIEDFSVSTDLNLELSVV